MGGNRDCREVEAGSLGRAVVGESRSRREEEEMSQVGAESRDLAEEGERIHLVDRTGKGMAALEDRTAAVIVASVVVAWTGRAASHLATQQTAYWA